MGKLTKACAAPSERGVDIQYCTGQSGLKRLELLNDASEFNTSAGSGHCCCHVRPLIIDMAMGAGLIYITGHHWAALL